MPNSAKVAMVAALKREVRPLVKRWNKVERDHEGRRFRFFENGRVVVVCGGIGAEAARRATEAAFALYQPTVILSVGFAGALDPTLKVGDIFAPGRVLDARDGSRTEVATGHGVLVSVATVAGRRAEGEAGGILRGAGGRYGSRCRGARRAGARCAALWQ